MTEPTDRSMPPVMITVVTPSAAMAMNEKFRVTLKMFCFEAKVSGYQAQRDAGDDGRNEHPERLAREQPGHGAVGLAIDGVVQRRGASERPPLLLVAPRHAVSIAPGDEAGHLLGRGARRSACRRPCGRACSTTMRSATANTSGMRWLIRTTAKPWSRRRRIRFRTSATCRTEIAAVGSSISTILGSERRVRAIATAWRWPPDIWRTRSRGRVSDLSSAKSCAGAAVHGGVVDDANGPDPASQLPAQEHVHARPSGCRTAPGPGRRSRCRAARASTGRWKATSAPSIEHLAVGRREVAGDDLHQRRLAGAVVAHESDASGRRRAGSIRRRAHESRRNAWKCSPAPGPPLRTSSIPARNATAIFPLPGRLPLSDRCSDRLCQ